VAQFRTRKVPLDGVLLIDKPAGATSHDVVARVRRLLRPTVKKVGHAGTLDPFATGLLVVLIGRATKLARFFVDLPKEYECTLKFGVRSDTGDLTGTLQETGVTTTREAVEAVLPGFHGTIMQSVPMTSAVKVDGERLYKKAHRGEVIENPVKEVEIESIEVLGFDADAQTLAAFEDAVAARDEGDERIPGLVDPAAALQFMPGIELSAAQVTAARNGARLPGGPPEPVRLTYRGELIAIYGPAEEGHALKLLVKL
jgi:tRNA pseudouridine(55) synthase